MTATIPTLLTFEQAIANAEPSKNKHLLLANGFSRAYPSLRRDFQSEAHTNGR
jgi:hypothetical protein